jgi:hypothetical protein
MPGYDFPSGWFAVDAGGVALEGSVAHPERAEARAKIDARIMGRLTNISIVWSKSGGLSTA